MPFTRSSQSMAVGTMMFLLVMGCSRKETSPDGTSPPGPIAQSASVDPSATADAANFLPKEGAVEGYTGSAACVQCHKEEHASWYQTYHRTMTQLASATTVMADFDNVVLTNETTRFHLTTNGNALKVKLQPVHLPPGATEIPSLETEMSLVTGSHHMQVFWLPEGSGNIQIGFPFTWLIPEKRWVPRGSTFLRPPDAPHRPEIWNMVCSRCHTTAVEPHINVAARSANTEVAELGISCEACHGPGEKHVAWRRDQALREPIAPAPARGATVADDGPIIQPRDLSAERASQICAFCHSMKWFDQGENWRDGGFHYRPGDDLEATTPIIRPSEADAIPALSAYLKRSPEILNDFFWSDGMIRVSGREMNGLIESPCYKSKQLSCLSCHSMHNSDPDGLVSEKMRGNYACIQCHDQYQTDEALVKHTRHSPDSSGSSCYNCHMPYTTYGVLKGIRSHQISNPKVTDQLATGRPNACNLCHLDQTLAWTADHLKNWYDQQSPPLGVQDQNVSSAARLALEGDAGQRVLLAWHLGWAEALKVSGKAWPAFVLAQLLDDPYAAIRCVAERSLHNNWAGVIPKDYDFTVDPKDRDQIRQKVWEQLRTLPAAEAKTEVLYSPADFATQNASFDQLIRNRNERPVRLRE